MSHILGLFLFGITLGTQKIREKQQLDDDKEDEELDENDEPQRLPHSHAAESIVVQMEHARPETLLVTLIVTHGNGGLTLNNSQSYEKNTYLQNNVAKNLKISEKIPNSVSFICK